MPQQLAVCTMPQQLAVCTMPQQITVCTMLQQITVCTMPQQLAVSTMLQQLTVCKRLKRCEVYILHNKHICLLMTTGDKLLCVRTFKHAISLCMYYRQTCPCDFREELVSFFSEY